MAHLQGGLNFHPIGPGSVSCDSCDYSSGLKKWRKDSAISSQIPTLVILTHDPHSPPSLMPRSVCANLPSLSDVRFYGGQSSVWGLLLGLVPGPALILGGWESGESQACFPSVRHVLSGAWGVRVLCKSFRSIRSLADLLGGRLGVPGGAGRAGRPDLEISSAVRLSSA